MGDNRVGPLPRTRQWRGVIDLVGAAASSGAIAAATLEAAESEFARAANDPGLVKAFWLLTQIPDAARSTDFATAMSELGFSVSSTPSVAELTAAFTEAVDREVGSKRARTGHGELAQLAAVETLAAYCRDRPPSLLGTSPDDVRLELGKLATEVQFGAFARSFFSRFTERFLSYFISRELPRHVGPGKRFESLADQREFRSALALHCGQASRIVEDFAGGWFSKARFEKGLSVPRTKRFLGYAFKKLAGELRRGAAP